MSGYEQKLAELVLPLKLPPDLILEVFGPQVGAHARTAVGVAGLPLDFPIEDEAEVLLKP